MTASCATKCTDYSLILPLASVWGSHCGLTWLLDGRSEPGWHRATADSCKAGERLHAAEAQGASTGRK